MSNPFYSGGLTPPSVAEDFVHITRCSGQLPATRSCLVWRAVAALVRVRIQKCGGTGHSTQRGVASMAAAAIDGSVFIPCSSAPNQGSSPIHTLDLGKHGILERWRLRPDWTEVGFGMTTWAARARVLAQCP